MLKVSEMWLSKIEKLVSKQKRCIHIEILYDIEVSKSTLDNCCYYRIKYNDYLTDHGLMYFQSDLFQPH